MPFLIIAAVTKAEILCLALMYRDGTLTEALSQIYSPSYLPSTPGTFLGHASCQGFGDQQQYSPHKLMAPQPLVPSSSCKANSLGALLFFLPICLLVRSTLWTSEPQNGSTFSPWLLCRFTLLSTLLTSPQELPSSENTECIGTRRKKICLH